MRLIVARSSLSPLTKWSGCQKLKLQIFGTLFVSCEVEAHTDILTHTHKYTQLAKHVTCMHRKRMLTRTTTLSWHLSNLSRRRLLTAICCLDSGPLGSFRFVSFRFAFGFVCLPSGDLPAFCPFCCLTNEEVFFRIC